MHITEELYSGDIVTLNPECLMFFDLVDKNYEIVKFKEDKWGMYRIADGTPLYQIRITDIKSIVSRNQYAEGDLVQVVVLDHKLADMANYRKYRARPLSGKIGKISKVTLCGTGEFPVEVKFEEPSETVSMFLTNLQPVFKK